jgi:uncharacterized coiled-coil protein SlyX
MAVANVIPIHELRVMARDGRVTVEQLLDMMERQQQTIKRLQNQVRQLTQRLVAYEPEVARQSNADTATAAGSASATSTSTRLDYSVDGENKRRHRRRRKKSPGRQATDVKFAAAERQQDIYPDGVRRAHGALVRERAVWRLENGRAVRVGYRIFAGPDGKEPRIPGVTPRCEYGIEILIVLAYLVYIIGISLDKACAVFDFFCQLRLRKSQADALLRQLAQHWDSEYDTLCQLLAYAAVVYLDETSWKVGDLSCSLWAFVSECQRVFLFGCAKDDATLDQMLPPDVFDGVGVSDDAGVYAGRFSQAQKCWAHLLRKAIRLALLHPRQKKYRRFLDQLLTLYRDAKRAAADGRLGDEGRSQRAVDFENRLCKLCRPHGGDTTPDMKPHECDFVKLNNEFLRLLLEGELFTFVLVPGVEPTSNKVERELRGPAQDRKVGRTNKTAAGAHRRSVIVSVLESLRANLKAFTLTSVLQEVGRWLKEGISLFARQWQAAKRQASVGQADTS